MNGHTQELKDGGIMIEPGGHHAHFTDTPRTSASDEAFESQLGAHGQKIRVEFDNVFEHIGHFGVFQLFIFILVGLPSVLCGFNTISATFLAPDLTHWCLVPELQNYSHTQQQHIAIPLNPDAEDDEDVDDYEYCDMFDMTWEDYTQEELVEWNRTTDLAGARVVSCDSWVYDRTEFKRTIVDEWDLVCSKAWIVPITVTLALSGDLFGPMIWGYMSDSVGRMPSLMVGTAISLVTGLSCSWAPNIIVYNILRWATMVSINGSLVAGFVLVSEMFGPRHRTWGGIIYSTYFAAGFTIIPGIAYKVRDYENLQVAMSVPAVVLLLIWWIVPESPRWLMSQGKYEEGMKILRHMGEVNNRPLPDNIQVIVESDDAPGEEDPKFVDLFHHPVMRRIVLINYLIWIFSAMSYYGTAVNTGSLAGDVYTNTFVAGLLEFPSNVMCFILLMTIGRRWTLAMGMIFGGGFLLASIPFFASDDMDFMVTVLTMMGKFGLTSTYTGLFVFASELFPTPLRSIGVGSCNMIAGMGTMMSPYFGTPLQSFWEPLPNVILGTVAVIGGFLIFLLPETKGKKMPDTITDIAHLIRRKSVLGRTLSVTSLGLEPDDEDYIRGRRSVIQANLELAEENRKSNAGLDNPAFTSPQSVHM